MQLRHKIMFVISMLISLNSKILYLHLTYGFIDVFMSFKTKGAAFLQVRSLYICRFLQGNQCCVELIKISWNTFGYIVFNICLVVDNS